MGAILLVSLTILLARPSNKKGDATSYETLEGIGTSLEDNQQRSLNNDAAMDKDKEDKEQKEEITSEIIEKIERRKWTLGFVMFGSAFMMTGAILLFLSDYEFTTFLGSCMIYVGIIALIKGISFELRKDKQYYGFFSIIFLLLIFIINFIMLTDLLEVIGSYAWAVSSATRKAGDITLVYFLPYLVWKVVPTFGASKEVQNQDFLHNPVRNSILLYIFIYILSHIVIIEAMWITIYWPKLYQYLMPGFQLAMVSLIFSVIYESIQYVNYRRNNSQ